MYFPFNSSRLSPQALNQLEAYAAQLGRARALQLHACADGVGGRRANASVAHQRAQAVRRWLAAALPRLAVVVVTNRHPGECYVASNRSENGRSLNRRVDLGVASPGLAPEHTTSMLATRQVRRK
ncbi:OmpA family protein [Rugamonas aquatica]|uniref:OmpA family protein n=1 Tax=Rugamonas aquatica TaxID=2743357 RepID=UPI001583DCA4|nr:OmpA family protein [Rugamonas aquatica]